MKSRCQLDLRRFFFFSAGCWPVEWTAAEYYWLCHCERFQERSQSNATDEGGLLHGLTSSLGSQASSVPTCSVQVRPHLVSYLVSISQGHHYAKFEYFEIILFLPAPSDTVGVVKCDEFRHYCTGLQKTFADHLLYVRDYLRFLIMSKVNHCKSVWWVLFPSLLMLPNRRSLV